MVVSVTGLFLLVRGVGPKLNLLREESGLSIEVFHPVDDFIFSAIGLPLPRFSV